MLALAGLYLVAAQLAFDRGSVFPVIYPLGGLAIATFGSTAVELLGETIERARIRAMFARFVPAQVVDQVIARAEGLTLGAERVEATIMFTDLRNFTTYSEQHAPDQVMEVLNAYFTEMCDAILDGGGTLTSYQGDGIVSIFGAPLPLAQHADKALACAREMLARLARFNAWMRERGYGDGFRMGIGINTGTMMVGNVGSERRLEYTAVGDAANVGSRLESMTKGTPHQIFIGEPTARALSRPDPLLIEVGELQVRGRHEPLKVFSTIDATDPAPAAIETTIREGLT
jgi:adenylate cyclase